MQYTLSTSLDELNFRIGSYWVKSRTHTDVIRVLKLFQILGIACYLLSILQVRCRGHLEGIPPE